MMAEQKDKIPAEEQENINKMIADWRSLRDKEDSTKEELDKEIERIEKEFQDLAQKYQAAPSSPTPDTDSEIENKEDKKDEWWTVEGEVIDADK
jgi:chromosome segregation ATPase